MSKNERIEASAPVTDTAAADLAELNTMAGAVDIALPGSPGEPVAPPVNLAAELSALVAMVVGVVTPAFPSVAAIYTPGAIEAAANAVARVCDKHGWLQGGVMGQWSEEIAAACVLVPLGMATAAAIRTDNAARAEKDKPSKPAADAPPLPTGGGGFEAAIQAAAGAN